MLAADMQQLPNLDWRAVALFAALPILCVHAKQVASV